MKMPEFPENTKLRDLQTNEEWFKPQKDAQ